MDQILRALDFQTEGFFVGVRAASPCQNACFSRSWDPDRSFWPDVSGVAPANQTKERTKTKSSYQCSSSQFALHGLRALEFEIWVWGGFGRFGASRGCCANVGIVQKVFSPKGVPRIFDANLTQI